MWDLGFWIGRDSPSRDTRGADRERPNPESQIPNPGGIPG